MFLTLFSTQKHLYLSLFDFRFFFVSFLSVVDNNQRLKLRTKVQLKPDSEFANPRTPRGFLGIFNFTLASFNTQCTKKLTTNKWPKMGLYYLRRKESTSLALKWEMLLGPLSRFMYVSTQHSLLLFFILVIMTQRLWILFFVSLKVPQCTERCTAWVR